MDTSARASASIPDGSGASPPALPHGRGLRSASAGALTARDNLGTASLEAAGRRDFHPGRVEADFPPALRTRNGLEVNVSTFLPF